MMTIFSMYNKKVGFYNPPTFSQMTKDAVGTNLIRFCKLNPSKAKEAYYQECELYYLGEFDEITGECHLLDKPEFITGLSEYLQDE